MLKLVWMARAACQKDLWRDFDPGRQLWIVSDAKTKFFLNQSLLQRSEIISEPVKRAKELWKSLLNQSQPEVKILEELGTKISARDFLRENGKSEWCKRPHAPDKLIEACRNLGPLISHESATDILGQFESEFKNTAGQFLEISKLSAQFYLECISRNQAPNFLVPYLLSHSDFIPEIEKELIFDLGFDLRDGERELIQSLARKNNITVLIPASGPEELEGKGLSSYRNFDLGLNNVTHEKSNPPQTATPKIKLWRCSSPEAEARQAIEQVRIWINEGVKPESICIASPHISDYEDILAHDLKWEGVGFQRTLKTPLSASRIFRALAARLRIMDGELSGRVLEEGFLTVADYNHGVQRRNERRDIKPVVDPNQIPHKDLKTALDKLKSFKFKGVQGIRRFESVLIELFGELLKSRETVAEINRTHFIKGLQRLRGEVGDRELDFSLWVEAWQEVTSQIAVNSQSAADGGVWGIDLSSCEENPAENLIILGCVEGRGRSSIINGLDKEKLTFIARLGFDLSPPLRNKNDGLIEWLISGDRRNIIMSCPKTDTAGRSISAGPLWIKRAAAEKRDLDFLDSARDTQWIHVQKSILKKSTSDQVDKFKSWPTLNTENISNRILEEVGQKRVVQLPEQMAKPFSATLSASQIEAYWQCPYKFFARSHLKLFDEADLELEPSPQARGQWIHSAVEKIMKAKENLTEWSDQEIETLIDSLDQVRIQKQLSSDIWPNIRARFLRQLKRFISFEIEWQKKYSRVKPKYFEAPLEGFLIWNDKTSNVEFSKLEPSDEKNFWVKFKGRVDRVDYTTDGRAIILDYKSSSGSAENIPTWAKSGSFQLSLYSEAIEAGFLEDGARSVIAAQYYVLRRVDREKGFRLLADDILGMLPEEKSKGAVDKETRDQHFSEIKVQVHDVLEKIRHGKMTPQPQDEKLCLTCSWRISCRAPHLN